MGFWVALVLATCVGGFLGGLAGAGIGLGVMLVILLILALFSGPRRRRRDQHQSAGFMADSGSSVVGDLFEGLSDLGSSSDGGGGEGSCGDGD